MLPMQTDKTETIELDFEPVNSSKKKTSRVQENSK
jgi:hypothetical protein